MIVCKREADHQQSFEVSSDSHSVKERFRRDTIFHCNAGEALGKAYEACEALEKLPFDRRFDAKDLSPQASGGFLDTVIRATD